MGYYNRWLPSSGMTTSALDAYRMQEVITGTLLSSRQFMGLRAPGLARTEPGIAYRRTLCPSNTKQHRLSLDGAWVDTSTAAQSRTSSIAQC